MGPPAGRLWFVSRDGASLVQLQPDRLYVNWRSTEAASAYPRWAHVRDTFAERLHDVFEFVHLAEGRVPAIGQVEVTYINALDDEDGKPATLRGVLKAWSANDDTTLVGRRKPGQPWSIECRKWVALQSGSTSKQRQGSD